MTIRPILFSAPMVNALLAGKKTQTRRILKRQPDARCTEAFQGSDGVWRFSRPTARSPISHAADDMRLRYAPGDLLWVRETWRRDGADSIGQATADFEDAMGPQLGPTFYKADHHPLAPLKWWPGIHMPRWASRLTLEVTQVRVERLQEISEEDVIAEGCPGCLGPNPDFPDEWDPHPVEEFRDLWESINGKRAGATWADNPWIVALTFKVHRANVDSVESKAKAA